MRLERSHLRWAKADGSDEEREAGVESGGSGGGDGAGGSDGGGIGGSGGTEEDSGGIDGESGVVVSGLVSVGGSIGSLVPCCSSRSRRDDHAKPLLNAVSYVLHSALGGLARCNLVLHCSHVHDLEVLLLLDAKDATVRRPACTALGKSLARKIP